jgi:phospholipid/cholesterol/gamma-HCH transport system substrate-binding protein
MARNQHWKAGLFVLAAAVIMIAGIALVAGIGLNLPRNRYTIRFDESVSGLELGAAVKYRGIEVGNVEKIRIPKDDITKVEVDVSIDKEIPIKTDTSATLSSLGITGIKFIDLQTGSNDAPALPPGSYIPSQESLLETLTATAQTAAEKMDVLLENLLYITDRTKVDKIAGQIERVLATLDRGTGELSALVVTMDHAAGHVDTLAIRMNQILGRNEGKIDSSFARLATVLTRLDRTLEEMERTDLIANAGAAAASARDVTADLRGVLAVHRRSISETMANFREVSANLNDFSRTIRDRPSLLFRSAPAKSPNIPGAD